MFQVTLLLMSLSVFAPDSSEADGFFVSLNTPDSSNPEIQQEFGEFRSLDTLVDLPIVDLFRQRNDLAASNYQFFRLFRAVLGMKILLASSTQDFRKAHDMMPDESPKNRKQ